MLAIFPSPADCGATKNDPIKIGVASMITPVDTVKYYQEVIDYIGERINRPVQMVHRRTYEEMDVLLEKGEVKIAFICSAPYVKNRDKFGVELLVAPSINGSSAYHSYIIVHKNSNIGSFPELKGRAFAFTDPGSNTGKLYPSYLLKKMGVAPEKFFNRVMYSYSHNKSVELVAKKAVDGAAVDSIVYEYMKKKGSRYAMETKIIKRSPSFGIPPVVVTRDFPPALREKIRDAFLNMHKFEKGRAILSAMMIDAFVGISDREYDPIREMERGVTAEPRVARKKSARPTVYFGISPRDNPRILYEKYQPLLDYLSARTPYTYELVLKNSYAESIKALGSGEMDIALLGPLSYLEARAKFGAICILKPRAADGSASYRSVIISRKDSDVARVSDLKGKSFAFSDPKSASGNLMARYLLADSGIHLKDLRSFDNFDYHDSVVKAVLRGSHDAGAVREAVAARYMKLGIKVIAESGPIPIGPIVSVPKTGTKVTDSVRRALLELDPGDKGHAAILRKLDDDLRSGFMEASDRDYADIRKKINAVPQTCGRGCHPKIRL